MRLLTLFYPVIFTLTYFFAPQPILAYEPGGVWVHHERQAPQSGIRTIHSLSNGNVWVDTNRAYHVFDGVRWKKFPYDTADAARLSSIAPFFGTREGKFYFYQNQTISIWDISNPDSGYHDFSTGIELTPVRGAIGSDGAIYIGSGNSVNGGIFRFTENGLVRLKHGQTSTLAVDHEGRVWATHRDSLVIKSYQLWMYDGSTWADSTSNTTEQSLSSTVTVAPDGSVWYNNYGTHDVFRNGVWEHYDPVGNNLLPRHLSFDDTGGVWSVSQNNLCRRKSDGSWEIAYTYTTAPDAMPFFMASAPDSGSYIFSGNDLLSNMPGQPSSWDIVPNFYDLGSDIITCMVYMDDGTLICGHSHPDLPVENRENAGLSIYDGTTWRNYTSAMVDDVKMFLNNVFAVKKLFFGDMIFSNDSRYNSLYTGSSWGIIDSLTYEQKPYLHVYDYLVNGSTNLYAATNYGLLHYGFKGYPSLINGPSEIDELYWKFRNLSIDSQKNTLYAQNQINEIFSYNLSTKIWTKLESSNTYQRDFIIVEEGGVPWRWVAIGNEIHKRYGDSDIKILDLENASILAIGEDGLIYSSGYNNTGYFDEQYVWHQIPELKDMQVTVAAFSEEGKIAFNSTRILLEPTYTTVYSGLYEYKADDTNVKEKPISSFPLLINYPNPFNDTTAITFELPNAEQVQIDIYSVTGQLVRRLVNKRLGPGLNIVHWDARSDSNEHVSSGLYLYRLIAGQRIATGKMLLLR